MGGDMTMRSAVGEGTTMTLSLPLPVGDPDEVEPELGGPVAGARAAARCRPATRRWREGSLVLLVEDHPVNRTVLSSQLETVGFQADTAHDGHDGYERFLSGDYALVLTDLNMPRMDGFELAEAIRAPRARDRRRAGPDHRADGERHAGRAGEVPRRGDGRLRRQADDDPVSRRPPAPLAAAARVAGGGDARRPAAARRRQRRRRRARSRPCSRS